MRRGARGRARKVHTNRSRQCFNWFTRYWHVLMRILMKLRTMANAISTHSGRQHPCGTASPAQRRRRSRLRLVGPTLLLGAAALLSACGDKPAAGGSQAAAKVNSSEVTVHQINQALQQQPGLRADQAEAVGRQVLERLIDQQLLLQQAQARKLDRDPQLVQRLEAVRREALARAYMDGVVASASPASAEEVNRYYEEHPELFRERRLYQLQLVNVDTRAQPLSAAVQERLGTLRTLPELLDYLKAQGVRFATRNVVLGAEQVPRAQLKTVAALRDGQVAQLPSAAGMELVVRMAALSQPLTLAEARPAIEQLLLSERKARLAEQEIKRLRAAATVEYVGKFKEPPGAAPSAPPVGDAAQPAAAPAQAASAARTLPSSTEITKGLALK